MNSQDRELLAQLQRRQLELNHHVTSLGNEIHELEQRLLAQGSSIPTPLNPVELAPPILEATPAPMVPEPISPVEAEHVKLPPHIQPLKLRFEETQTPVEPPPMVPRPMPTEARPLAPDMSFRLPPREAIPPQPPKAEPVEEGNFEERLGSYWLVRIGILLLLTGLAFLGNYAYQNYVGHLGPLGKIILMYLGGAALLGTGSWLERKTDKPNLKNYGQVLAAGGLAAIYFTTYAAHYFEPLRVITSPLLDGFLLVAWATFIAWLADRRKSETLALFGIGLAYYSSAITQVGSFTLVSNVVLAAACVFFLLRNNWVKLGALSLIATYGTFFYWSNSSDHPPTAWFMPLSFLASYWLIHTVGNLLCKPETVDAKTRAFLMGFNNLAAFALACYFAFPWNQGGFANFSFASAAIIAVLALIALKRLPEEKPVHDLLRAQSIILVVLGTVAKFSGGSLTLALAAEAASLALLTRYRSSQLLRTASVLLAIGSLPPLARFFDGGLPLLPTGVAGALLAFASWWLASKDERLSNASLVHGLVAITAWGYLTVDQVGLAWRPAVLGMEAVGLTLLFQFLRGREMILASQFLLGAAQLAWFAHEKNYFTDAPWLSPLIVIASTIGLGHWWQRQRTLAYPTNFGSVFQSFFCLAGVGLIVFWVGDRFALDATLVLLSLITLAITVYAVITRLWALAVISQFLLLMVGWRFFNGVWHRSIGPWMSLVPIGVLLILAGAVSTWVQSKLESSDDLSATGQVSNLYRLIGAAMGAVWVFRYAPHQLLTASYLGVGLGLAVLSGVLKKKTILYYAAFYTGFGMLIYFTGTLDSTFKESWLNALGFLALLGVQQWARKHQASSGLDESVHNLLICTANLALWLFVTHQVRAHADTVKFLLTLAWGIFALLVFAAGFMLRERAQRWMGLIVLGFAVGRIVLLDVWRLETGLRILTFMGLGLVLLLIGYVYNRYSERIREWL